MRVIHLTTIDLTLRFLLLKQLKALQRAGYNVAAASHPGPWVAELQAEGIMHYPVPSLRRVVDPIADAQALVDLVRLFRRERFDIVHTHMPKTGVLGRIAARLAGVPIVVNTVHGPYGIEEDHGLRRLFFLSLERLAARCSDFELSQSREVLDQFRRAGILRANRSAYLGNGTDLKHFDPDMVDGVALADLRAELKIPPQALIVGTVGRLVWDKGYREFLAAAEQVRAVRADTVFIAVGPAETRDRVPTDVIRGAEAQGVRFPGLRRDIRELYAMMDVFVLASYREGFPRSAIEAAAMAKPLILTDIRGCREVVAHDVNGWLVPVRTVEPLTRAILRLLEDNNLRRHFGEESRRRAVRDFDEDQVIERVLQIYRHVIGGKRGIHVPAIGAQGPARR